MATPSHNATPQPKTWLPLLARGLPNAALSRNTKRKSEPKPEVLQPCVVRHAVSAVTSAHKPPRSRSIGRLAGATELSTLHDSGVLRGHLTGQVFGRRLCPRHQRAERVPSASTARRPRPVAPPLSSRTPIAGWHAHDIESGGRDLLAQGTATT